MLSVDCRRTTLSWLQKSILFSWRIVKVVLYSGWTILFSNVPKPLASCAASYELLQSFLLTLCQWSHCTALPWMPHRPSTSSDVPKGEPALFFARMRKVKPSAYPCGQASSPAACAHCCKSFFAAKASISTSRDQWSSSALLTTAMGDPLMHLSTSSSSDRMKAVSSSSSRSAAKKFRWQHTLRRVKRLQPELAALERKKPGGSRAFPFSKSISLLLWTREWIRHWWHCLRDLGRIY